jgi:catechol 2,3-dioxygenase-like lactoylglutathione lyase family enzyme
MSITNVSLVTVYVTDQDEAKRWYVEKLGFVEHSDVTLGAGGFRWVTVAHPDHPELEVTLMVPGPPLDDAMAEAVRRALANGTMGGLGLRTDDCHKTYEELRAKGVEFIQPPSERPYGTEAILRDNSGSWLVLVEPKEFDFAAAEDYVGAPEADAGR